MRAGESTEKKPNHLITQPRTRYNPFGMSNPLYPIGLNVRGRKCVVVGGGPVGTRKMRALIAAEGEVVVVAPTVTDSIREAAKAGTVTHRSVSFFPEQLDGAFLAVAATDSAAVNAAVAAAARERGVLLNIAGDAEGEDGDFVTMASVVRDGLLIAVTTGGASPALAARVRRSLETQFGQEWSDYLTHLRMLRTKAKNEIADTAQRAEALRRLANSDALFEKIVSGEIQEAWEEATACL